MATARSVLRQRMSELIDDYRSLVTTATTATTSTVLTSAALADYAEDIDSFPFWYALFTTGATNGGIARPVKRTGGNTAPTILTVTRAYPGAIGNGDTFELHRFNPDLYHAALSRAALTLYHRGVYLPVRDETLVVDNLLANWDFETGTFTSWTLTGAGAAQAAETTFVRHGSQAAKITSGSGAAAELAQILADAGAGGGTATNLNIKEHTGRSITFKAWVLTSTVSNARIGIYFGTGDSASSTSYSSYHTGKDQWELLEVTTSIPQGASQVKVLCQVAAGSGVGYFDASFCYIRPVYRYTTPTSFIHGPYHVYMQDNELHPEGAYYDVSDENPPVSGRILRLTGKNYLSQPSTETGTMEVEGDQVHLVCWQALAEMFLALTGQVGGPEQESYAQRSAYWQGRVDVALEGHRPRMALPPRMGAPKREGWRVEEDGETRYLYLTDARG